MTKQHFFFVKSKLSFSIWRLFWLHISDQFQLTWHMLFLVEHSKIRCDLSNVWTKVGLDRYMVANHQHRFQSKFRIAKNEIGRYPHMFPDEILVVRLQVQLLTTFLVPRTELNKQQQTNSCLSGLELHRDDWCHRHKVLDCHINPEK